MPPRKGVDPDADATEILAANQAEHAETRGARRDRFNNPQQGDAVRLRGVVVEPIQQVTQNRGRPEGSLQVRGRLFNGTTGATVTEEREWTVVVNNYLANVSKEHTKAGDVIEAAGKWVETYRAGRFVIDSEIQAWDLHPPLDPSLAQELGGPASGQTVANTAGPNLP
jgi:hypothetical protein